MSAGIDLTDTAGDRRNELARLIFSATDLSSVHRLRQYLARHPDLWPTLSEPLRSAIAELVCETSQIEYLVPGFISFSQPRPDFFSLYSF